MPVNIHGAEYAIKKVFSNDFVFTIQRYQRPYAWTTEQAGELLEDLLTFLGDGNEAVDEVSPYFLGSIVLIKGDAPDAEVVDGQQRLTTLTILLAALRALVAPKFASALTNFLYEESDPIVGTPNRYRLTLRPRDAWFFQEHIQDEGNIMHVGDIPKTELSDSQRNLQQNALLFLKRLGELPDVQRVRLAQFIINRCFLVVVSTPDLDSAYRIFSVLNDRGLDLGLTDILKSEIIGKLPEAQQDAYTFIWESEEVDLGRDAFQELFAHIRMIYLKAKPRATALKEFRQYIRPADNPQEFIEKTLKPYSDAFEHIKHATYESDRQAEDVNRLLSWLNQIDNFDWVPPAIRYLSQHQRQPEALVRFFTDLERLAAGLMIRRANINERLERYGQLLSAIERGDDLFQEESPLQLRSDEKRQIVATLDGDLYLITRIRQYILLRLDTALAQGDATYNYPVISVEHVLPQNPNANSVWIQWFPDPEARQRTVHRLGNLALLSKRKNAQAQNYDFETKKQKYFATSTGVSPFALTTQVLHQREWTPAVIDRRQRELVTILKGVWRL